MILNVIEAAYLGGYEIFLKFDNGEELFDLLILGCIPLKCVIHNNSSFAPKFLSEYRWSSQFLVRLTQSLVMMGCKCLISHCPKSGFSRSTIS